MKYRVEEFKYEPWTSKGQIITKCLFEVLNFFQKTNDNASHSSAVKMNLFGRFFEEFPT